MPKAKKNLKPKATKIKSKKSVAIKTVVASKETRKIKNNPWAESYISLLLGVIFVIAGVIALASFLKSPHSKQITATSIVVTTAPNKITIKKTKPTLNGNQTFPTNLPKTYTVKANDDLWHIAKNIYGSGYNWVDIAKANNLTNPGLIFKGEVLTIPQAKKIETSTISASNNQQSDTNTQPSIISNTYTVKENDNLWEIAVRAYADGYKWIDIAKANNLTNPGLIFKGQVLTIPR